MMSAMGRKKKGSKSIPLLRLLGWEPADSPGLAAWQDEGEVATIRVNAEPTLFLIGALFLFLGLLTLIVMFFGGLPADTRDLQWLFAVPMILGGLAVVAFERRIRIDRAAGTVTSLVSVVVPIWFSSRQLSAVTGLRVRITRHSTQKKEWVNSGQYRIVFVPYLAHTLLIVLGTEELTVIRQTTETQAFEYLAGKLAAFLGRSLETVMPP